MGAGRILGAGSRWAGALLVTLTVLRTHLAHCTEPPRRFVIQFKAECQFTNGTERVRFLGHYIYNQQQFVQFDSKVGVWVGETEVGRRWAEGWNKDPAILADTRTAVDKCRHNYRVDKPFTVDRRVQPKVKVSPTKSGSQPHPHLLVCSVTGFYPGGIEIQWLKNGQEQTAGVVSTELLQNGDWTFQILVMLEMSPRRGDVYTCQVEHISLRGPLAVHWASPHLPPASLTFRVLKTTVFHNASSTDMWGTALLGDLETHSLACSTCEIRFLQPWAQQGLTPKQWQDLELLIHRYLADFFRLVNKVVQDGGGGYPFVTQVSFSCELQPNGTSRRLCDAAVDGQDFISFDMDTGKWVTRQGDRLGSYVQDLISRDTSMSTLFPFLQRTMCVYGIDTFAQHGRESLERQERPVAVVFARAPPPAGTPAPVLLVCRVTGFYPRPVRVAWLQDGEEVVPGWWLNSSGILPNADLTYQLRSSLGVEPGAGHSYACQVQHSSLGGQSLLIPWEQSRPWGPGLAVGITLGVVAVAAVAVVLWRRRRRM
ncbi:antigen-presenting glycoprotein CD1d2-like isoform X2 [Mauremys reevesii]|uniref:antigen-presenting glycoprotein CD1d2-like isoform X2 n=1 Tax=Mauremys reevesii TaxID=260615 RepID=UPI00193FA06D|nr:antigen-presenting glycoprotein CD1d2-like isoform X2 [Mauremys reevesii]